MEDADPVKTPRSPGKVYGEWPTVNQVGTLFFGAQKSSCNWLDSERGSSEHMFFVFCAVQATAGCTMPRPEIVCKGLRVRRGVVV